MIKQIARKILRHFGIIAFKRSSRVYIPEEESYLILSRLVAGRADPVVIDGGAHLGDAADALGALLPGATIHCFEPDPTTGRTLEGKFAGNPRVRVVHAALGDRPGKAQFNINVSRPTNSLLPVSESLQPDLKALAQLVERVEVDITTLDDYCRANSIDRVDVVKLDLQGYDYLALKGATATLASATVVLTEVLFKPFYQGCHLFHDILDLMRERGFSLYTLSGLHYGEDDELFWADAIFVRAQAGASGAGRSAV